MAALTACVCGALQLFCEFADAIVYKDWNLSRSIQHIREKNNHRQFLRNCRQVWIQALSDRYLLSRKFVDKLLRRTRLPLNSAVRVYNTLARFLEEMQRRGIDFAAIEASSEAYEAMEDFAIVPRRTTSSIGGAEDLLDGYSDSNQQSFDLSDNFYDIEVLSGQEIDSTYYDILDPVPVYKNDNIGIIKEGVSFTFTGHVLLHCERFSINFIIENSTRDVALHINPRLPQNYIVRNTKVKGKWGREDVSSALPFALYRGRKFAIQVFITDQSFLISVNGIHFAKYQHRLPYDIISTIEVKGDVDNVDMVRSEQQHYPDRIHGTEPTKVSIALTDEESGILGKDEVDHARKWGLIQLRSSIALLKTVKEGLTLPYYGAIPPESLKAGRCLLIQGRVKLLPHSFYINLQSGQHFWPHPIVAFHFNPRFSKQSGAIGKAIVCRNAWYNGHWAAEERSELDTDFRPGKAFKLVIACLEQKFQVYLNRKIIVEFNYHMKPEVVDTIYIQGDIKLWQVKMEKVEGGLRESTESGSITENLLSDD